MPQTKQISQHFYMIDHHVPLELRSTFRSRQSYKAHRHAELSVGAIIGGRTCVSFAGQHEILEVGDVVFIPPEVVHACNPVGDVPRSYHMLYLDPLWFSRFGDQSGIDFGHSLVVLKSTELFSQYLAVAAAVSGGALSRDVPELVRVFCSSLMAAYQATCSLPENIAGDRQRDIPGTNHVSGISARIHQEFMDKIDAPPSLKELSGKYHQRPETIIRHFSRDYGMTPKALVNNLRVEQGKKLLRSGYSIIETAMSLGFSDQSQFHKAFVQYTAATPNQYRKVVSIFDNK